MEKWKEIFKDAIPIGKYQTSIRNGEETGLIIELESNEHSVEINFGVVSAVRMLDEGIILNDVFDEEAIMQYKTGSFSNVIYQIYDGDFADFVKKSCEELYDYLDLKHFILITMNYVIEVISEWEPEIRVL